MKLLGDYSFTPKLFPNLPSLFRQFKTKQFTKLVDRKRSEWINRTLLELIQKEPDPCFLLPAVLDFIKKVDQANLLQHYTFNSFELWLNHFSNLSPEENYQIRAKIAGKWVRRIDYQDLFPIGLGKTYEGSHFVTAHQSPDLDTTIASFWGWLDAFAARVGNGLHIWNLPGDPSALPAETDLLFRAYLGPAVLSHLPKHRLALTLTGNELMTRKNLHFRTIHESIASTEHDRDNLAIIIVDPEGFYVGDWRATDAEEVGQLIILLFSCLRWFENNLAIRIASLFAQEKISQKEISSYLQKQLFDVKMSECEPAREFTLNQKRALQKFLTKVLHVKNGLESTFEEFAQALSKRDIPSFLGMDFLLTQMKKAKLFNGSGILTKNYASIFRYLEHVLKVLHEEIVTIRAYLERFDIALAIKKEVFDHHPTFVTNRSDLEEIRLKMGTHSHLTVVYPDQGRLYPIGIVRAADLRKSSLGTVSLRDFCNREEMTIPSYLSVISVIDHHKSSLTTYAPPLAIIGDVQSSNTLTSECAIQINDRYSLGGMTPLQIEQQIEEEKTKSSITILQHLLQRKKNSERSSSSFIHPDREFLEYLHFLYAILDDTDLLTKVTMRDVQACAVLLNRLCSISLKKEIEIICVDDLIHRNNPKEAAQKLLQTEQMYSLYRKTYEHREKELNRAIRLAAQKKPSDFFLDTKEQNGCCRVGQTKLFSKNITLFTKEADAIRHTWVVLALESQKKHPELDLHLHMISTIASADEVFQGTLHKEKNHRDELWIWIPSTELGIEHLKIFLNAFQGALGKEQSPLDVEFLGPNAEDLSQIFKESFFEIPHKIAKKKQTDLPIAILRYRAGSLNSRKAMISPYLPILAKS